MDTWGGNTWHTTEPWHNSPLPEGVSHAVTVPPGRGWALWRPLRTNTDRNTGRGPPERNRQRRPWRSWELWKPWRCRELRWPWRCWELWRPWRSWELWRPWRSWELWRPWRSWELWKPWQMVFGGLGLGPLGPALTAGTPFTPPKNFPGEVRGYQEPSGARHRQTVHG